MKLKNVKPLEYNVIKMVNGLLEITTFNQKTKQLVIYKVDDLVLSDDLMLIVDDKTLNMIKLLYEVGGISIKIDGNTATIKGKNATYKASMLEKKSLPILDENVKLQQQYSKKIADSDFRKSNQALIERLLEMTIENKLLQDLIYRIEIQEIRSLD